MNRKSPVILLFFAVLALGFGSGNLMAGEKGGDINSMIEEEKKELERLKSRIEKHDRTLSMVGSKETSILKTLQNMGDRLKVKERELKIYQWNIKINKNKIARLEKEIRKIEDQMGQKKRILSQRLRAIYKEGSLFPIKVLFSSDNFNDLLHQLKYMELVAANDSTLFMRYANRLKILEGERIALLSARRKLLRLEEATIQKQKEIKNERNQKSRFLKNLKKEKKLSLRVKEELLQASDKLNHLIRNLEEKLMRGEGLNFADNKGRLLLPVQGPILNKFGKKRDKHYQTYIVYNGINIKATRGAVVRSIFDGKVLYTGSVEGYGNLVILGHGEDYHSLYGHLDEILTQVGKVVRKGQIIGRSGDTGSLVGESLYFELRYRGKPIEPTRWFKVAKN